MVNTQQWFNQEYPKEVKKIKIMYEEFKGELLVENYRHLEKLYLLDTKNIDKLTLQNLDNLQECTIWNCGTKELTIENCPQIKKLNVRSNSLTNLEFIKFLSNLEKLELDGNTSLDSGLEFLPKSLTTFACENTKLIEVLKPYKGDWNSYKRDIEELKELASQNPQELLKNIQDLKKEINMLKEKQPITIDNSMDFQEKYQNLKKTLNSLLEKEQIKTEEIIQLETKSNELNLVGKEKQNDIATCDLFKKIKESRNDLSKLKKVKKELETKLADFEKIYFAKKEKIEQKVKELRELKNTVKGKLNDEEWEFLKELLEAQDDLIQNNSSFVRKQLEKSKNKLINKLTIKELDNFCQLQAEITQLNLEIQKNLNQINNYSTTFSHSILNISGGQTIFGGHNENFTQNNNNQQRESELLAHQQQNPN